MYFMLSGEGPTDLGHCINSMPECEGSNHEQGPMALIVSQIVEQKLEFSFIDTRYYCYVSKSKLVERANALKHNKRAPILPGKKRPKEAGYFYKNARALALCAKDKKKDLNEEVIAVLFRDSDGTASAGRGLWDDKRNSMIRGFHDEEFEQGVPMIPKPKSEAWIICSIKDNPYQNCDGLEERSGNDKSPNSLKDELAGILGYLPSRYQLCEMINDGTIDCTRINMYSFLAFKDSLLNAMGLNDVRP